MRKLAVLASMLVLAGSLGVAALFAGAAPSFAPARSYATGLGPTSVAIGDLNGDGKPDMATANVGTDKNAGMTISVLLNRGKGTFQAKLDYATGANPLSVAIGDLNGDGKTDLATANFGDTVSVLLNTGDGSFQAKLDYATGDGPGSIAIGDLNGDGKPDLATANFEPDRPSTVSVLLNRGDGSFQAKVDYRTGDEAYSVAIGDLNGDDKPDLATANSGYSVSVLLNRGDGSFRAKHDHRVGKNPLSVAIGDLNGDGKPDLATANEGANTVSVLLNSGDGRFQAKLDYGTGSEPSSVAIGELNGDGKPDLATANSDAHSVSVLLNRGDGSFRAKLDYRTGNDPQSVVIAELSGDGKADLATANTLPSTVSVLINTPGLCTVQDVKFMTLAAAKRTIARAKCRVGKIRRAYSKTVKRGRVISEKPRPGTVLPNRGKVSLAISRGRKPS
jgi:hypothetical protein